MKKLCFILLLFSKFGFAQDCSSKISYFDGLEVDDLRPVIAEMRQYRQTADLTLDCKRRLDYLLAVCYEVTGKIDSARYFFYGALESAKQEKVDSHLVKIQLQLVGFYSRRRDFTMAKKLLSEAGLVAKRLVKNYDGFDENGANTKLVNPFDEMSTYNQEAKKLEREMNPNQMEVLRMLYQAKGNLDLATNQPEEAKKQFILSYQFAKANPHDQTEGNILNNIGMIMIGEGNYQRAAEFLHEALLIAEKNNDPAGMVTILLNLSSCYIKTKKISEASSFARKAREISEKNGYTAKFSRASIFLAKALNEEGKTNEAVNILETSIDTANKYKLKDELAYTYRQFAEIILNSRKDLNPALAHAAKSREYTLAIGDSAFLGSTDLTLGKYFLLTGKLKEALEFTKQSLDFNYQFKEFSELDAVYKQLADIYAAMGDYKNANVHLKNYEHIKDSLLNREIQLSLQDLERKYESKSKALTISKLEQEQQLKELELQKSNNRTRLFIILGLAALAATGLFIYFNRQLAKQKKAIEASNIQLSELTSLQNRLFRIISHDLKSMILPFNRAGKIMNHYLTRQETEQANKYANKLEENAVRLSGTLNNLLYWSSQQLEGYVVKPSSFEVRELVEEVTALFEELIRLKDISVHNSVNSGELLYTDREAFHVILRNLLSNAVKYTEHGSISFSSGQLGDNYFLEIKDDGRGMDQDQVNSLLSGVLQESKSGTLGEKGSGLGFSIIKKLAVAIKADYKINSESGKGTSVRIIFKKEKA